MAPLYRARLRILASIGAFVRMPPCSDPELACDCPPRRLPLSAVRDWDRFRGSFLAAPGESEERSGHCRSLAWPPGVVTAAELSRWGPPPVWGRRRARRLRRPSQG